MAGAEAKYTEALVALRELFSPGVWQVQIDVLVTMKDFKRAVVEQAILDTSFGKIYSEKLDALPPDQAPRWRWFYMPLAPATMPFFIAQMTNLGDWLLYEIQLNWQHLLKLNTWMLNTGAAIFEEFWSCGEEIANAMDLIDSSPLRRRLLRLIKADRNLWARTQHQHQHRTQVINTSTAPCECRHLAAPELTLPAQQRQWQACGWRIHG
jgi:hypothetical protein